MFLRVRNDQTGGKKENWKRRNTSAVSRPDSFVLIEHINIQYSGPAYYSWAEGKPRMPIDCACCFMHALKDTGRDTRSWCCEYSSELVNWVIPGKYFMQWRRPNWMKVAHIVPCATAEAEVCLFYGIAFCHVLVLREFHSDKLKDIMHCIFFCWVFNINVIVWAE